MGAIHAIFRRNGSVIDTEEILPMMWATRYRAVDGQAVWHDSSILLAHQHFWVTPEEMGETQPFVLQDGRFAISFEGRLDNRKQLWEQLRIRNASLAATSDATLALLAYLEWGIDSASHLLGDFGYVIWDREQERVYAARDPLGVYQVCYAINSEYCLISSTVESILAHGAISAKINERKIGEFLLRQEISLQESYFENIFFCPPAHWMSVTSDKVLVQRYWLPAIGQRPGRQVKEDVSEGFRELLQRAVADRTRCTGTIGVTLSGGMDSTSVVAFACKELDERGKLPAEGLKTYTLAFDRYAEGDERRYVELMKSQFPLNTTYVPSDDIGLRLANSSEYLNADNIMYVPSNPLFWHVGQVMHDAGHRLQLTGGFGDMLFSRQTSWAVDLFLHGRWHTLFDALQSDENGWNGRIATAKQIARHWAPPSWLDWYQKDSWKRYWLESGIHPDFLDRLDIVSRRSSQLAAYGVNRSDLVAHLLELHWSYYNGSHAASRSARHQFGLETWEPFRDRRLVEFVLALPAYELGLPSKNETKRILRRALHGILPDPILNRSDKTHFGSWLRGEFWNKEWSQILRLFDKAIVIEYGFVESGWLANRLAAAEQDRKHDFWPWINLELWLRRFENGLPQSKSEYDCSFPERPFLVNRSAVRTFELP